MTFFCDWVNSFYFVCQDLVLTAILPVWIQINKKHYYSTCHHGVIQQFNRFSELTLDRSMPLRFTTFSKIKNTGSDPSKQFWRHFID